ncbi:family 16 glycosylhydrolase [Glycomyces salinus]|uniref:family 16 glycosylhydrolase n=1 Tax=Glycomyces salinus TaxID=980294 RepID=UPI0018EAFF6E|nr:family 16 glycosylhydrolase [Glycomyces salinus]
MAIDPKRIKLGRRGLFAGGGALALSAFLDAPASAAEMPPNPLEKPGWILDRHDEFDGGLDPDLWITNYLESRTPAWRSEARYHFRNNALVLRIDDDQPTYYSDNPMKVSSIQTGQRTGLHKDNRFDHSIPTDMRYTPRHGYFEIRAKSSARSGFHTAFWMIGRQDTWEQRGELDIMEHAGIHGRSRFNYNLFPWSDPNLSNDTQSIGVGFDMTTEMHIYAVEWNSTQMKLYIDNQLRHTINQSLGYPAVFLLGAYENAGWTGDVDPDDPRPKEFVVDYFRAYKPGDGGDDPQSGRTYKLRNASTGRYLDADADGAVILESSSVYDDQHWTLTESEPGYWTIDNVRSGRGNLDTQPGGEVIWNDGWVGDDSLWAIEPVSGGFRIGNKYGGRGYLYGSGSSVGWNTGATDANTVWELERQ